jgi:hypothetical protein
MANQASMLMSRGAFPNHVNKVDLNAPSVILSEKRLVFKNFPQHNPTNSDTIHKSRAAPVVSSRMLDLIADGTIPLKPHRTSAEAITVNRVHKDQMYAVAERTKKRTLTMDFTQQKTAEKVFRDKLRKQTRAPQPLISELISPAKLVEPRKKTPIARTVVHQAVASWQLSVPSEKPIVLAPMSRLPMDSIQDIKEVRRSSNVLRDKSKTQISLISTAAFVLAFGLFVSFQTLQTNKSVTAQVSKIANQPSTANVATTTGVATASTIPSTVKPTPKAIASYAVSPDLAKYIKIPSLGVDARVGQVGILSNGALGTPPNVFDTAWYSGSAEPGQPGATLIDGHVSSWTSKGVFYGIHTLSVGDTIQIVKGDNTVVNYVVVKTQTYGASGVDMQAAITPIDPTVSGLNLITCTGHVIKGTSLFNQRVIVFAKEVN